VTASEVGLVRDREMNTLYDAWLRPELDSLVFAALSDIYISRRKEIMFSSVSVCLFLHVYIRLVRYKSLLRTGA